jgi:V/A-type H+-transporting ATPase subunit E
MTRRKKEDPAGTAVGEAGGDETLEAFVARLHDEGVEAGRQEAERVVREARREAKEIVRSARSEAESLVAAAKERVAEEEARARAELELAARDAVLELRAALTETLSTILARRVSAELSDAAVVERLLEEVVRAYAKGDAARRPTAIRVSQGLAKEVGRWWRSELSEALRGETTVAVNPVLEAGFEYRIDGGTVEVSIDATVSKIMELMRPRLAEIVADGTAELGESSEPVLASAGSGDRRD